MEKIEETYITKRELEVTLDAAFKNFGKEFIKEVANLIDYKLAKMSDDFREYVDINVRVLRDEIQELRTELRIVQSDITEMKADISELKIDVSTMKADISELKTDVAILKVDVSDLKADVSDIKDEMVNLRCDVAIIYRKTRALEKDLN